MITGGSIHCFFEGYFVWNHAKIGSAQDVFGQLWKEYSLSDSRYLASDTLVLCMETITATCWGPLSFLTAMLIAKAHPLRYPLQAVVSVAHIYGDAIYFATSLFDLYYKGISHCRPELYYFWLYFFFLNFIWIAVPGCKLQRAMWLFLVTDECSTSLSKYVCDGGGVYNVGSDRSNV